MNKPRLNTMAYFATGIAVTWFTSVLLFAAPPATKFQRGQTLDPGCLPTDPNCSVEDFVDTDAQTLALSGSTLSILHWNSITLPVWADDLGDHTATQNIRLNSHRLSQDGDDEGVFVTSSWSVGIGTSGPLSQFEVRDASYGAFQFDLSPVGAQMLASRYMEGAGQPRIVLRKARGTPWSPAAVQALDYLGSINFNAFRNGTFQSVDGPSSALIRARVESTPVGDSVPAMLLFNTTASGATASSERMRITADGYVTIGTYTGVPASLVTVTSKSLSMDQLELQSMRAPISGGNVIGGISFRSNDTNFTTPWAVVASIEAVASATHTASALATDIIFKSTAATSMDELARLTGSGKFWIGQPAPVAKLDVGGSLRIADGGEACSPSTAGLIRYNAIAARHEGCNGTAWNALY